MIILHLLYFYIPVAIANMAPVLVKNHFKFLAKPIDGGKQWKGRDIFGSHKTWRGIISATIAGGCVYLIQYSLASNYAEFNNLPFDYLSGPWWFGFLFGFTAIIGDLIESFFKRQFANKKPGQTWFPWDQLDFLITASMACVFFFPFKAYYWLLLIIGVILHISINRIGFWLKLKNTPW